MQEFGVARETGRKAVRILRDEGLVQIVQGRGAFVTGLDNPPGGNQADFLARDPSP
jgi:DNA-binding GntR family transcriptional regulator